MNEQPLVPMPTSAATPEPAATAATPSSASGSGVSYPAPAPTGRKVLCIEDEHFISELYVRALNRAGYHVTVEVDGLRGLKLAQTDKFDIILLDLMIPTITGTEVLRRLRDLAETPRLRAKVIITTNLEQREDVRQAIEHQADGYLVKAEITPRELVQFLDTIK